MFNSLMQNSEFKAIYAARVDSLLAGAFSVDSLTYIPQGAGEAADSGVGSFAESVAEFRFLPNRLNPFRAGTTLRLAAPIGGRAG